LQQIARFAESLLDVRRIWLFGSRARGGASKVSDVDLGFELGSEKNWARFTFDAEDEIRSLLDFDLVNMNSCQPELRSVIEREGIVLYERPAI
jgi:predicted nucleotidyltransferase